MYQRLTSLANHTIVAESGAAIACIVCTLVETRILLGQRAVECVTKIDVCPVNLLLEINILFAFLFRFRQPGL